MSAGASCSGVLVVLISASLLAGCEREARRFELPRESAALTESLRLSTLLAGGTKAAQPLENPFEHNAPALAEGSRLFRWYNCNGCHANGGGSQGPPLMDAAWIYGSAPENVFATIVQGRPNGMPAFGGHLPDQQIWKLVAYVRAMSGLVPADAAPGRRDSIHAKEPENRREETQPEAAAVPKPRAVR